MALRRRSYGHQHRPDWEQRLCRVDAELAEGELSPAQARERYRALGREQVDELAGQEDMPGQLSLDMADAPRPDSGEPPPPP